MFHIFKKRVKTEKSKVTSKQDIEPPIKIEPSTGATKIEGPQFLITEGMLHCCCSLTPEAFQIMMGNSRLPFKTWYLALWEVQHDVNIKATKLMTVLGVSWPIARNMKERIIEVLTSTHSAHVDDSEPQQ